MAFCVCVFGKRVIIIIIIIIMKGAQVLRPIWDGQVGGGAVGKGIFNYFGGGGGTVAYGEAGSVTERRCFFFFLQV